MTGKVRDANRENRAPENTDLAIELIESAVTPRTPIGLRSKRHRSRDSVPERLPTRPRGRYRNDDRPLIVEILAAIGRWRRGAPLERTADELGMQPDEFEHWCEKFRRLKSVDVARLEHLERENRRLKRQLDTLRLDQYVLKQLLDKKP
jgi:transposase-like protein